MQLPSIYIQQAGKRILTSLSELEREVIYEDWNTPLAQFVLIRIRTTREIFFNFVSGMDTLWIGYAIEGFFKLTDENGSEQLLAQTQLAYYSGDNTGLFTVISRSIEARQYIFLGMRVFLSSPSQNSFYKDLFTRTATISGSQSFIPAFSMKPVFLSLTKSFYVRNVDMAHADIALVLSEILSHFKKQAPGNYALPVNPGEEDLAYLIAENIILEMDEQWSIEKLAYTQRITPKKLKEIFKKYLGLPAGSFMILIRMERATQLLHDSTASIQDISMQVGYPNPAHFSKLFRQKVGMSPSAFRRNTKTRHKKKMPL